MATRKYRQQRCFHCQDAKLSLVTFWTLINRVSMYTVVYVHEHLYNSKLVLIAGRF